LVAATALGDVTTGPEEISGTDAPNGTIFDRFDAHGITWRDYFPDLPTPGLFLPDLTKNPNNFFGANQFLADAAAGQLANFSIIDPYDAESEESGDVSIGEAYAARMIEAVMSSPNWPTTVMFLVYDEHGGWYDHVPPVPAVRPDSVPPNITVPPDQPGGYDFTGFRVPCVVISPFARRNFVSHVVNEHTSLLKFIETKWNLPAMTFRDANASNMFEFFDFHGRPPFLEPPRVASPLNPFLGPLPAHSDGADAGPFHPIANAVDANSLPPAAFRVSSPPVNPPRGRALGHVPST
jgi:phospholipase C